MVGERPCEYTESDNDVVDGAHVGLDVEEKTGEVSEDHDGERYMVFLPCGFEFVHGVSPFGCG